MKRTIAIIILLTLVPVLIQANKTTDQEQVMVSILEDLEGTYTQGDISANQKIYDKFLELDILEGIGYNIKENLGMDEIDRLTQSENNYSQINLYGYDKDNNQLTIILSSYFNEEAKNGETYLYINFLNKEQFININGIIENVEGIYNDYNVNAEITTNIVAFIDEKIESDDYQYIIEDSIHSIDGSILGTFQHDNLISYNIHTPWIDNFITIGKDNMNLNIAIRCNNTEDKTVIYIGTPIITGGY